MGKYNESVPDILDMMSPSEMRSFVNKLKAQLIETRDYMQKRSAKAIELGERLADAETRAKAAEAEAAQYTGLWSEQCDLTNRALGQADEQSRHAKTLEAERDTLKAQLEQEREQGHRTFTIAIEHQDRADTAEAERANLRELLEEVKQCCLFVDDDGSIGVSEDVVIPVDLFNRIAKAAKTTSEEE